jgi:hypothetical protein
MPLTPTVGRECNRPPCRCSGGSGCCWYCCCHASRSPLLHVPRLWPAITRLPSSECVTDTELLLTAAATAEEEAEKAVSMEEAEVGVTPPPLLLWKPADDEEPYTSNSLKLKAVEEVRLPAVLLLRLLADKCCCCCCCCLSPKSSKCRCSIPPSPSVEADETVRPVLAEEGLLQAEEVALCGGCWSCGGL